MSECSICLGPISDEQQSLTVTCGHLFHLTCLRDWLHRADDCPNCREILVQIAWYREPDHDVLIEHCPDRVNTVWRRVTRFSHEPGNRGIQRLYRFKGKEADTEDEDSSEESFHLAVPPPPPAPPPPPPLPSVPPSRVRRARAWAARYI